MKRTGITVSTLGALVVIVGGAGCQSVEHVEHVEIAEEQPERAAPFRDTDARVKALVREGDAHLRQAHWLDAIEAYESALAIDPDHAEARWGFNEARIRVDEGSGIDGVATMINLRRTRAVAEFDAAMTRTHEAIGKSEYALAKGIALHAKAELSQARGILHPDEYEAGVDRANEVLRQIEQAMEMQRLIERGG